MANRTLIETYTYKGYTFKIEYSKKDNMYYATSPALGQTYDFDLQGVKQKIHTVVYQNTEFKL